MNSEYTKGELRVSSSNPKYVYIRIDGKNAGLFAECDAGDYARSKEEGEANAKELVRRWNSQPDLLEACEGLMEKADNGSADFDDPTPDSIYLKAKAAIAKAQSSTSVAP